MRKKIRAAGTCGFTLIELMVVIMIFAGASAAGYTMYVSQQHSYVQQEQVAELQQNIRSAFYILGADLRMAGYDPTEKADAGITIAEKGELAFTADIGSPRPSTDPEDASFDSMPDGIINPKTPDLHITEQMRFALQHDASIPKKGFLSGYQATVLGKEFNGRGGLQPIIGEVEGLEFFYHLSDGTAATAVSAVNLSSIRSVTVSLLVRTRRRFGKIEKDRYFYPGSNPDRDPGKNKWGPFNDAFMRRLVITTIQLRNMGLLLNS